MSSYVSRTRLAVFTLSRATAASVNKTLSLNYRTVSAADLPNFSFFAFANQRAPVYTNRPMATCGPVFKYPRHKSLDLGWQTSRTPCVTRLWQTLESAFSREILTVEAEG